MEPRLLCTGKDFFGGEFGYVQMMHATEDVMNESRHGNKFDVIC